MELMLGQMALTQLYRPRESEVLDVRERFFACTQKRLDTLLNSLERSGQPMPGGLATA